MVGAGATGGYFGGRLLEAGLDVTFLVGPGRSAQLAAPGATITRPAGDVSLPPPPTVLAPELRADFDVVILSCKAYDLDAAIESVSPEFAMIDRGRTQVCEYATGKRDVPKLVEYRMNQLASDVRWPRHRPHRDLHRRLPRRSDRKRRLGPSHHPHRIGAASVGREPRDGISGDDRRCEDGRGPCTMISDHEGIVRIAQ